MHDKKKLLPILFILFLLLVSLASPAAACTDREQGHAGYQKLPSKICLQKDNCKGEGKTQVYQFRVPLKRTEMGRHGSFTRFYINRYHFIPGWSVKPGPAPVPRPEPRPLPRPEPVPDPQPNPVPDPYPTPGSDPVPDPHPGPGSDPAQEPDPAPGPEPGLEPGSGEEPWPDPGQGQETGAFLSKDEAEMWRSVNEERRREGLQPLAIHEGLVDLARLKSADMIKLGYFSHQSPTYGSPFEMISGAGITYHLAGENIAGAPTVARAHQSLMNSSGHRANILQKNFTHVGIGIVDGGPYGKMFTQIFIGLR
ncbi:MAG: CAP domain-containing protein [Dethiobacteria bacterium]|jgi:uncharacterized YkwD family protein